MKKFFSYLLGKSTEIQDLDVKDIMLTKVILDIHRKRTGKRFIFVPLFSVKPIHVLDRENAVAATRQRARALRGKKNVLVSEGKVDRAVLADVLPSVSWIKVVREKDDSCIAFEGNGRLAAMKEVFSPEDGIMLEVEEYIFRNPEKIIRRMNRVRKMNGLGNQGEKKEIRHA